MEVLKCLLLKNDLSWEKEKFVACSEGTVGYSWVGVEKGDARNRLEEEWGKEPAGYLWAEEEQSQTPDFWLSVTLVISTFPYNLL